MNEYLLDREAGKGFFHHEGMHCEKAVKITIEYHERNWGPQMVFPCLDVKITVRVVRDAGRNGGQLIEDFYSLLRVYSSSAEMGSKLHTVQQH